MTNEKNEPDPRPIVVVDVETNGLDDTKHEVVEVAWWNLGTGERACFVPRHDINRALGNADLRALQMTDYVNKIAPRMEGPTYNEEIELYNQLAGATLLGSNVQFDARMISNLFRAHHPTLNPTPWHHRLWEIGPYAAGVLGLDYIPGLWDIAQLLGIPENDHTAWQDVTTTGECFLELQRRRRET